MDDTLWVASSQNQLINTITIAESFYNMANIKVNPSKSILTTNKPPLSYNPIIFNNHQLQLHPSNKPFKFLGCWFTLNNKQVQQTKIIIHESNQLIQIAKTKRITETQAQYIINTVIIPTIEYRLHNIVLSQNICNKIFSQHIGLVKLKAKLSRTIPSSTLLHPQIYNIKHIWDIQLQHHITNYIKRLNNKELLGISTQIRLQQLQNNLWSPTRIFSHLNPIIDGPNKLTTNFKIIQLLNHLGIDIPKSSNSYPHTLSEGSISLESILNSHPKYSMFKTQLRHHQILFLDQLTSFNNQYLLDWKHISPRINKIPKGKKPSWFSILEDLVTSHSHQRTLYEHFILPDTNYFSFTTGHFSTKPKPWLITTINNQIIIGKARRKVNTTGYILVNHWKYSTQLQNTNLYPTLPTTITQCLNCHLNSNTIPQICTILIPINLTTKFLGRINPTNKSLNPNANLLDLVYSIAIRHPIQIPLAPSLYISSSQIPQIFDTSTSTSLLQNIADNNSHSSELSFYTDGSVIDLGTNQCSMGIGWVQIENSITIHTFQAQTKYWPCSFKAELTAILSAIVTAPRNCFIQIYTDSQSVISKYNSIIHSPSALQHTKTPYSSIWSSLINFVKAYSLTIQFHKVTAHQDNEFNNLADQLAHNHYNCPYLIFNPQNTYNSYLTYTFDNFPIELPIRRCIRTICHAQIYALWSSQNRFQQWTPIRSNINWSATWQYINNNQKISNLTHSFQSSTLRSFRVKTLLDELPTPHILHKRYPSHSPNCHQCNIISTPLHWVVCPSTSQIYNLINCSLNATLNTTTLDLSQNSIENLHSQIKNLNSMTNHNLADEPSLFTTLTGLIPNNIIHTINNFTDSTKISTNFTIKFLLHLNQQIYKHIWIPYCISRSDSQPQITLTHPTNNRSNPSNPTHTLDNMSSKLIAWYPAWIKYQAPLTDIISNNQI
jgi:ribonuclease HI